MTQKKKITIILINKMLSLLESGVYFLFAAGDAKSQAYLTLLFAHNIIFINETDHYELGFPL